MKELKLLNKTNPVLFILVPFLLITGKSKAQEQMTLQECRERAMKHNKEIEIATENEETVNSLQKSAKTLNYPKINFNGGYFRLNKQLSLLSENMFLPVVPQEVFSEGLSVLDPRENPELVRETMVTQDVNGVPLPVEDPETGNPLFDKYAMLPEDEAKFNMRNVFFGNIGLNQPIYMGGKIKQTNSIAHYGQQMMQAKKHVSRSEVIVETDKRYWEVISLKEKVKLAEEYLNRLNALLSDVKNLHEEGIVTNNKVMQVEVKKNKIELRLTKAENGLELSRMALNQTLGFPLDSLVYLSDSLGNVDQLSNPKTYKEQALEERSEIQALKKGAKIAESGEQLMKSRYLPNIGLTANYTFTNPNPWNGFESEFGGTTNIGVFFNIPIYNWGERKHTMEAAKHQKRASMKKLEETRELISLEVKKAVFRYNESIKKIEMTKSSLEQAKDNLRTTKDNFEEGMAKSTDVLEAQSMWQEAYADYIEAMTEYKLNKTELMKASGQLTQNEKQ
ncbi:MAG: TolC family protein [Bacteroidales bacterium]